MKWEMIVAGRYVSGEWTIWKSESGGRRWGLKRDHFAEVWECDTLGEAKLLAEHIAERDAINEAADQREEREAEAVSQQAEEEVRHELQSRGGNHQ